MMKSNLLPSNEQSLNPSNGILLLHMCYAADFLIYADPSHITHMTVDPMVPELCLTNTTSMKQANLTVFCLT
jgi:hypothetical protein